jgi:hypothetical protein
MSSCCSACSNSAVAKTTSDITWGNRLDHFLARWGYKRSHHRVNPGLYALGDPGPESPVFVTADYTLSFDALRGALKGRDAYILVLDTKGINVWCAAGKGTFGTDELVNRIQAVGLADVVRHRRLILPQLGAVGVAAHEVKKRSGFLVTYGPVRAADLPQYLDGGGATPEMRRVRFTLRDRLALVPVEITQAFLPTLVIGLILYLLSGIITTAAFVVSVFAGMVLFPILLPWIPTRQFSSKGFFLGYLVTLPFSLLLVYAGHLSTLWSQIAWAITYLMVFPPITAFYTLNFTGATTFTSKTGVRREMFKYIPRMAASFGLGLISIIILLIAGFMRLI